MGTDSSGLPLCEPGTHDHGGSAFVPSIDVSNFASFPQCFCVARAGERGKVFRNHFAATTSFQKWSIYYSRNVLRNHNKVVARVVTQLRLVVTQLL